jgi:hypothetical protein
LNAPCLSVNPGFRFPRVLSGLGCCIAPFQGCVMGAEVIIEAKFQRNGIECTVFVC